MSEVQAPLVAIVTPVYNGGQYLQETLDCVQAQTYPNLVHVVLDNASTDDTAQIIAANRHRRVPLLTARNDTVLPLCQNWNTAMQLAPREAKYLRLLCADDTMLETCTQRMVEVAEADSEIQVVGVHIIRDGSVHDYSWPRDRTVLDGEELIRGFFRRELGFYAIHTLVRRAALDWRPQMFDCSLWTGIDFEATLALLRQGKLGMVHEALGWVRVHAESETSKVMLRKNTHFVDWMRVLYRHGPHVFTAEEFRRIAGRNEQRYLRLLLQWQRAQGKKNVQHHWDVLRQLRGPTTPWHYAAALYDWALIRLGVRSRLNGWP